MLGGGTSDIDTTMNRNVPTGGRLSAHPQIRRGKPRVVAS
jgi:hypothetical protein